MTLLDLTLEGMLAKASDVFADDEADWTLGTIAQLRHIAPGFDKEFLEYL